MNPMFVKCGVKSVDYRVGLFSNRWICGDEVEFERHAKFKRRMKRWRRRQRKKEGLLPPVQPKQFRRRRVRSYRLRGQGGCEGFTRRQRDANLLWTARNWSTPTFGWQFREMRRPRPRVPTTAGWEQVNELRFDEFYWQLCLRNDAKKMKYPPPKSTPVVADDDDDAADYSFDPPTVKQQSYVTRLTRRARPSRPKVTRDAVDPPKRAGVEPPSLARLREELKGMDHQREAQKAVNQANFFGQRLLDARGEGPEPPPSTFATMPLVLDTGASNGLTPFREDFIDFQEIRVPVNSINKTNYVTGVGTTMHKAFATDGSLQFIPGISYLMKDATIRLKSPQSYFQSFGGSGSVDADSATLHLGPDQHGVRRDVVFPIDRQGSNIPMLYGVGCSAEERETIGPHLRSCIAKHSLDFDEHAISSEHAASAWFPQFDLPDPTRSDDGYTTEHFVCVNANTGDVTSEANTNLSPAQKELLMKSWIYGISMHRLQELMKHTPVEPIDGKETLLPPVLPPKLATAATCDIPRSETWELARAKTRSPKVKTSQAIAEREGVIAGYNYKPGDFVSTDQFVVSTPGRLLEGYGRESAENCYDGGTIFVDACSGAQFVSPQVSLGAEDTVSSKQMFEDWLYDLTATEVKHYHSDNGVYTSAEFRADCKEHKQTQTFSGVGAKFQNARAERAIQTIMAMARTFIIHVGLRWSEWGTDSTKLWPFAVRHAVWLYNRLPNRVAGMTPLEMLTNVKSTHEDLRRAHVWGCPVYVLDPKLQDKNKIPKFNRRSRRGQFMGFSAEHSSLVALVRNLETGHVSPQYHVVFDDHFHTVFGGVTSDNAAAAALEFKIWEDGHERYAEDEFDADGELIYTPPPLDEVWLSQDERHERRERLAQQRERTKAQATKREAATPGDSRSNRERRRDFVDDDSSSSDHDSEGGDTVPDELGGYNRGIGGRLRRRTTQPAYPAFLSMEADRQRMTHGLTEVERKKYACTTAASPPIGAERALRAERAKTPNQVMQDRLHESDKFLSGIEEFSKELPSVAEVMSSPLAKFVEIAARDSGYSGDTKELLMTHVHPLFLQARSAASSADNPRWGDAMASDFAHEWFKAAQVEVQTLEEMDCWEVVDRDPSMKVIGGTWALKLKRYPDGLIKKFKARFCARGDQQTNDFETYAPVVQWTTIRLMLILEVLLGLKSKQGDVTAAFVHAPIPEGTDVFVSMPQGFGIPGKVLKLRRQLYGLKDSPRQYWLYTVKKMEAAGLKQSTLDPCLFVGDKVICVAYVDDYLFWSKDEADITSVTNKLRDLGVNLQPEDDTAGFLGIDLKRDPTTGTIEMTQTGLIDRVLVALGLDHGNVAGKWTPAEGTPLVKDVEGAPAEGQFNYASVVGMLLYLSGNTRPDITYAVNCCARYMANPRLSHEKALKRIGRYLKLTRLRGLIIKPTFGDSRSLKIDCYPDADFAGLYGHERYDDPTCVKSRTGFVITINDAPLLAKSALQKIVAVSTMEAEILALAHSCQELFPLIDITQELGAAVGLPVDPATMQVSIHEDNAGALVLADMIPPQFTPRAKTYHVKTIWFREEIKRRGIKLLKIASVDQLGDLFTKGLSTKVFQYLRKKLQGW